MNHENNTKERRHTSKGANGVLTFFYARPLWVRGAFVGMFAAAVGLSLDAVAHLFGVPWTLERVLAQFFEGGVLGFVAFHLNRAHDRRMARRMREVAALNHHIRNALQAIELAAYQIQDRNQRTDVVDIAAARIQGCLAKMQRDEDLEDATREELESEGGGGHESPPDESR